MENEISWAVATLYCYYGVCVFLDHYQKLISSSLYYAGPLHKFPSQSVQNILSNVNKQSGCPVILLFLIFPTFFKNFSKVFFFWKFLPFPTF